MDAHVLALGDRRPVIDETAFVAPGAVVVGDVTIAARASIWYGTVVRADLSRISIGAESNIQDGCVLHADPGVPLTIGDRVTVGHRVVLHGATLGNDILIGMGAVVMNHVQIGDGSIIGAGALLTQGTVVPAGSLVMGAPARIVREVRENERVIFPLSVQQYMALADEHRLARPAAEPSQPSA